MKLNKILKFKPIKDYPNYLISKRGRIFSLKRGKLRKWNIRSGRVYIRIRNNDGFKLFSISRLVAQSYIPNPNNYPIVMHLDDDPLNNYYKNLKWGTNLDNALDREEKGRGNQLSGDDCPWTKHLKKDRDKALKFKAEGLPFKEILRITGIPKTSLHRII